MYKSITVEQILKEAIGISQFEKTASKINSVDAIKLSDGLNKIASLPYKQEAYDATCAIVKIASDCLKSMTEQFNNAQKQISEFEKLSEVRSIIDEMIEGGYIDKDEVKEKVAELNKKSHKDLEIVKEAMKLKNFEPKNIFFDSEKTASMVGKRGIFDNVDI